MEEETDFDRFWKAYPARKGDKAKQPARVLFEKHIRAGVEPLAIIDGAKKYAELESSKIGTEFIMQAQRWLRNKRWMDFEYIPLERFRTAPATKVFVREDSEAWKAWQAHLLKTQGKRSPVRNFGWYFPTEWPPHE